MYGPESSCATSTDYVAVDIKDYLGVDIDSYVIRYTDEPKKKQWNYYYIDFKPILSQTDVRLRVFFFL